MEEDIRKGAVLLVMTDTEKLIKETAKNLAVRSLFIEAKAAISLADVLKDTLDAFIMLRNSFFNLSRIEENDIDKVISAVERLESRIYFVEDKSLTMYKASMN